ncbi:hypothetical protein BJV74DRAFT_880700 [Russula compacta]|nr:hypothetical protein BJV74DRAFT_880700 [Russula compacta]
MTIDTIELRKIQYAQELVAYTMRQWTLTQESLERKRSSTTNGVASHTQNSNPRSGCQTRDGVGTVQCAPGHAEP